MRAKNIFKSILIIFILFIGINVIKAYSNELIMPIQSPEYGGEVTLSGPTDNGTYDYWILTDNSSTRLYCLDQGRNPYYSTNDFTSRYALSQVYTTTSNNNIITCAVIRAAYQNGQNDYKILQKEFWNVRKGNITSCNDEISSLTTENTTCTYGQPTYGTGTTTYGVYNQYSIVGGIAFLDSTNSGYYIAQFTITHKANVAYHIDTTNFPTGTYLTTTNKCNGTNKVTTSSTSNTLYACIPTASDFNNKLSPSITISNTLAEEAVCRTNTVTEPCSKSGTCTGGKVPYAEVAWYVPQDINASEYQQVAIPYYELRDRDGTPSTTSCSDRVTHPVECQPATDTSSTEIPLGRINITKTNVENEEKVEGAKFSLYIKNTSGEYVEVTKNARGQTLNIVTDENGFAAITSIPFGVYKLVETTPAEGYVKETIEMDNIKVSADMSTVPVNFTNTPIKTIISKQDITSEKELPGAKILITDENNEKVVEFTSSDKPTEIYIGPGKYKLTEVSAPKGYETIKVVFEFEILKSGKAKLLSAENKSIKTDNNKITIYDAPIVEVPDTGKMNVTYIFAALIVLIIGGCLVFVALNRAKINSNRKKK